jgi:hypothetical protein
LTTCNPDEFGQFHELSLLSGSGGGFLL